MANASGGYSFRLRAPGDTVAATLRFAVPVTRGQSDTFTSEITGLETGSNARTFDVDYTAARVSLRGTLRWLGTVRPGRHTFSLHSLDTSDSSLGIASVPVDVAPDGTFGFEARVPLAAARVVVSPPYLAHADGRFGGSHGTVVDVTRGQVPDVAVDFDSIGIGLTGVVTRGGEPVANETIALRVNGFTGADLVYSYLTWIWVDGQGRYALDEALPSYLGRVTVAPDRGGTVYDRPGAQPGIYDEGFDFDVDVVRQVVVEGHITQDGQPYRGDDRFVYVEVRGYDFDPAEHSDAPPYTLVASPAGQSAHIDEDGSYQATVVLPYAANVVEARVTLDRDGGDDATTYSDAVVLTDSGDAFVTLDIGHGVPRVTFTGTASTDCAGNAFLFEYDIWAFDESDGEPEYDPETDTWGGGEKLSTRLVVPDPTTGAFQVTISLPAGTVRLGRVDRASGAYTSGTVGGRTTYTSFEVFDGVSSTSWDVHGLDCPAG